MKTIGWGITDYAYGIIPVMNGNYATDMGGLEFALIKSAVTGAAL